ncbi:hypothetical protein [Bradyrhizobium sp. 930_D9_N1_4]|uniref:hypothetical protein n=1 Tax=Bradyrhizobium sp. 930_D9_N1_4 TaxID=3240374 RepID=UPI003F8B269C
MQRPDNRYEVMRRHNAAGRARASATFLAGLSNEAFTALSQSLAARQNMPCHRISSAADIAPFARNEKLRGSLLWGRDRIGIGLLKALRAGQDIQFEDHPSPYDWVVSKSGHLVVCEEGEDISEVIAANYAHALDAGLFLIPKVSADQVDDLMESFYGLYDRDRGHNPADAQSRLTQELLNLCGSIPVPENGSVTFIGKLPFGFAYPEYPVTHLFKYPDLGCAVVNGFAAEQVGRSGTGVVVLVDPGTTLAPEIKAAVDLLEPRRAFIRVYQDRNADVRNVSEMVEHFPYDLLIFATHCGDSSGYRWTCEFTDSEGLARTIVVDVAVGFARTDDPQILNVGHFFRFVELDGVDWSDREAKSRMYVGNAIHDFNRLMDAGPNKLPLTKKETVARVIGSSAMMMSDSNFIFAHHTIADVGTPIVINNACVSWHRLAGDMTFAGARAYVGTLFPVTPFEASEVITKVLDAHWEKPLAAALWAAQRDVYGSAQRRPYVVAGVYTQRLRVETRNYPERIRKRLEGSLASWRRLLQDGEGKDLKRDKRIGEIIKIYEREFDHFNHPELKL